MIPDVDVAAGGPPAASNRSGVVSDTTLTTPPLHHSPLDIERLHALLDEVLRVNQQFNLTSVRDPDEAWIKHIVDSLQGLATGLFEGTLRVVDVGSGAGFPGLPLAIARPHLKLSFIEATRKKSDFIAVTAAKLSVAAKVFNERAEIVGQDKVRREAFHVATARAVGSLPEVCELVLPLVKVGGHAVLWRGSRAPEELKAARGALRQLGGTAGPVTPYQLPRHEPTYHIVVIHKTAATPPRFPRRSGLPKQQPL